MILLAPATCMKPSALALCGTISLVPEKASSICGEVLKLRIAFTLISLVVLFTFLIPLPSIDLVLFFN